MTTEHGLYATKKMQPAAAVDPSRFKAGQTVVLSRDWATYKQGTRFNVVKAVDCGEVTQADGSTIRPVNLRVVLEGDDAQFATLHRTIPAEYAIIIPAVNSNWTVLANHGSRDGVVVATIGTEILVEYEMPAGRTYGRIINMLYPACYRAVPMAKLPKKWKKELAA